MNDASAKDSSAIKQDHMGNLVDSILMDLDDIIVECLGSDAGGQFDSVIGHCETYLDDYSDGIQDSEDSTLSSWRPALETVERVISAPTKRLSGGGTPKPAAQPAATPAAVVPEAVVPTAKEYYIRRGNKVMGPVSAEKVRGGIDDGRVRATDQLSEQTSGPWQTLESSEFSTCF